jgi:Raf kinase inhibitor-like YbhB/YbcL family protein
VTEKPKEIQEKRKTSSAAATWMVTVLLAALIIGGALMASQHKRASPPVPVLPPPQQQQVKAEPVPAPASAPAPVQDSWKKAIVSPPVSLSVPSSPPAGAAKAGTAILQLDHLAGTLKMNVPVLTARENRLPLDYTCYRANISPPLQWTGAPQATKSFVLFLEKREIEANPQETWIIFNVPGDLDGLEKNIPKNAELENGIRHAASDQGVMEYTGPCEPRGKVDYAFRLFALDTVLGAPAGTKKDDLIRAMNGHIIDADEVPFIHYLRF